MSDKMDIFDITEQWITRSMIWMSPEDKEGFCDFIEERAEARAVGQIQRRIEEMDYAAKWDSLETKLALRTAQYEIEKISNQRARTDAGQAVDKARRTRW